jgi:UDP-glucose 4-epimerase
MKKYFITGGAGFVGRNLAKRLLARGSEVYIIDNLFTGRIPEEWLDKDYKKSSYKKGVSLYHKGKSKLYFIKSDVVDFFQEEIKNKGQKSLLPKFDDIFHLASVVGGRELIEGDPLLIAKDLAIDSYFFLWLSRFPDKVKRVLYPSSSAAYPIELQNTGRNALKENDLSFNKLIGIPDETYGWSKVTGELLSRIAYKKYGIHIACVRPFSGYGEDQEVAYPIPAIARRVAARENPLTVWGDGKQGRDFVHIDDVLDAFFVILDNVRDGSGVNIGSGKLTSFLEVLKIFSKIEGYNPEIVKRTDKPVGVINRYCVNTRLKKMGWKNRITIKEGFMRVLEYQKVLLK